MQEEWKKNGSCLLLKNFSILIKVRLSNQILHIGFFRQTATDETSYTIDESSSEIDNYESYFEFFGMVLSKAILDEIPLNLCLSKVIFKMILDPD